MKIELSSYDWQDAIAALKVLHMDTMPIIELSVGIFDGDEIALVQSIKDKLETLEKGTYDHQYALDRLNRLFKAYA